MFCIHCIKHAWRNKRTFKTKPVEEGLKFSGFCVFGKRFSFCIYLFENLGNSVVETIKGPGDFRCSLKGAEQQVTAYKPASGPPPSSAPLSAVITMLRTVLRRALPRFGCPAVCRYSAAAIPAPNTQPEVHFNKVRGAAVSLRRHQQVPDFSLVLHLKLLIYCRSLFFFNLQ